MIFFFASFTKSIMKEGRFNDLPRKESEKLAKEKYVVSRETKQRYEEAVADFRRMYMSEVQKIQNESLAK